ncbi:MAG: hypothetical protein R3E67_02945 [Pseudomonadales bacterium]
MALHCSVLFRVSMAGLVVAVALLITVLAVMNGFEHSCARAFCV